MSDEKQTETVPRISGIRGCHCEICDSWAAAFGRYRGSCECGRLTAASDGAVNMPDGSHFRGIELP